MGPLPEVLRDLVDLGATVFLSDILVPVESGFRSLDISLQVREPGLWRPLKPLIEETLKFLMRAPLRIHFLEGKESTSTPEVTGSDYDVVALLSGGLDSFAGALSLEGELSALMVSHYNNPQLASLQRRIMVRLQECGLRFDQLQARVKQRRGQAKNSFQSARSFLYLSIAGAAALASGAQRLLMFENGPIALGTRYTPARLTTRTAHPFFLNAFEEILGRLTGERIRIENPFESMTKGEIVGRLTKEEASLGLRSTISCSRRRWVWRTARAFGNNRFEGRHCGICVPCLHRRVAVSWAGYEDLDDAYAVDALRDYPFNKGRAREAAEALINVRDLLIFSSRLQRLETNAILAQFPDLIVETETMTSYNAVAVC